MPAGSKMDLPLAKAKPIINAGSASAITLLEAEKVVVQQQLQQERVRVCETTLQTSRSVQKEGQEVLQAPEQRFPCSPWSRPWQGRLCPCSPRRSMVEQRPTCSLGRTPRRSRGLCPKEAVTHGEPMWEQAPGRTCGPMERGAHARAGLLAGLVTPWKGPMLEQFVKSCTCGNNPCWSSLWREYFPWEGPHAGAGAECEEEGAAETTCDELIITPIPCPPAPLGGRM